MYSAKFSRNHTTVIKRTKYNTNNKMMETALMCPQCGLDYTCKKFDGNMCQILLVHVVIGLLQRVLVSNLTLTDMTLVVISFLVL